MTRPFLDPSQLDVFPSVIAATVCHVPVKTLDNWNRRGILRPKTSVSAAKIPILRNTRLYTFREIVAIRVLVAYRDAGVDLGGLKRVVEYLRKRKGLSIATTFPSVWLVNNGEDVFELEWPFISEEVFGSGAFIQTFQLGLIVGEVQRDLRAALRDIEKAA